MSADPVDAVPRLTQQLLGHLDIAIDAIQVDPSPDSADALAVNLQVSPADSGILIGYHAETLSSLQLILSLMVHQQLKSWYHLAVNVNDYRQNREATLTEMAHNAAQRVRLTGKEVVMPYLESFERRLIHMALSGEPDITTVSLGESRDRRLVIRPQTA